MIADQPARDRIKKHLDALVSFRRRLHQHAELPLKEKKTAELATEFMMDYRPDRIVSEIGGYGLAFVFEGETPGPTVLIRCDMDALPINETIDLPHRSLNPGVSHKCGHDGHMAIAAGLATLLSDDPPKRGRVVLLYQPAEETGEGAALILKDPKFEAIKPDYVFALHNFFGAPLGSVFLKADTFHCASQGMTVKLHGSISHASNPENGKNPARAMCRIIEELDRLPLSPVLSGLFSMATIVHAKLGEPDFGIAPGEARVDVTLRTETDDIMSKLVEGASNLVDQTCRSEDLCYDISYSDVFTATINDKEACRIVKNAAQKSGCDTYWMEEAIRGSEDFGRFTSGFPGAIFGLGAGESCPPVHTSEYDFPDALIPIGTCIFHEIVNALLS